MKSRFVAIFFKREIIWAIDFLKAYGFYFIR